MAYSNPKHDALKIFISYPTKDGLPVALQARDILKQFGHKPWVFTDHHTWGAVIFEQIYYRIRRWSHVFLYICTSFSLSSWGQRFEVAHALRDHNVKFLTIALNGAKVPGVVDIIGYERLQNSTFQTQFKSIANNLPQKIKNIQRLEEYITAKIE